MNNSLNLCFSSSPLSLLRSLPIGVSDSINQTQITDVPALLNKVCVHVCCRVCMCVACVYVPIIIVEQGVLCLCMWCFLERQHWPATMILCSLCVRSVVMCLIASFLCLQHG